MLYFFKNTTVKELAPFSAVLEFEKPAGQRMTTRMIYVKILKTTTATLYG